jgi:hypothetical protein
MARKKSTSHDPYTHIYTQKEREEGIVGTVGTEGTVAQRGTEGDRGRQREEMK